MTAANQRILLKLSGEALMGDDPYGINEGVVSRLVEEVAEVIRLGVEVGVVIGGGNIFRGMAGAASGMDRATADYMGMLATVMNAMAVGDAMRRAGLPARVQSALRIDQVVEPYIRGKAIRYLEEGKVVIFAAGTGTRSSRPIPPPPCVARKSGRRSCSRPPRWMASILPTRRRMRVRRATSASVSTRRSRGILRCWMQPRLRFAGIRSYRSASSVSSSQARSSAWFAVRTKARWSTAEEPG
jgi:hypothetical protein